LADYRKERNAILNCDWPIRLLFTSYCLTFLYVPWVLGNLTTTEKLESSHDCDL